MKKEILLSGLLGGLVILVWLAVSRGPIPLSGDIPEQIPNDKDLHTTLKETIPEPGLYYLPGGSEENQALYEDYANEPLFMITNTGRTPNTFLGQLLFELFGIFIAPMIAAWMLSMTSVKILSKYSRRVLFVTVLGLFLAVYGDIASEKPMSGILLSSIGNLITWALAGLVIAWRIKPHVPTASAAA